eukprot:scaffold274_cov144-Skeletonema_menzelii.AAC.2
MWPIRKGPPRASILRSFSLSVSSGNKTQQHSGRCVILLNDAAAFYTIGSEGLLRCCCLRCRRQNC